MQINQRYEKINELISYIYNEPDKKLSRDKSIDLANEVLLLLGAPQKNIKTREEVLNGAFSSSEFRNQKMEGWFERHPFFGGARVALKLYDNDDSVYESNFYQMTKSATKARIASTVMLSPNWEDSRLTMLPTYKVGIDFFLTYDAKSLLIILSKEGHLRVLELNERLSNTQITIFENLIDIFTFDGIDKETGKLIEFEPQRTIHKKLWEGFELKEVNRRFYLGVADHFELLSQYLYNHKKQKIKLTKKEAQIFSNRLIGRLLFIWFLKKKDIVNKEYNYFGIGNLSSKEYYYNKLVNLFFETLNTQIDNRRHSDKTTPYLNGGLFDIHDSDFPNQKLEFPEDWFNSFYKHLNEFNFTTDESTIEYQQLAIDPEMLGRVFENLLASITPETAGAANERKNKGAFYTPREIVSFMCKESLRKHIQIELNNESLNEGVNRLIDMNDAEFLERKSSGQVNLWGIQSKQVEEQIINILNDVKIIDPAVGSGAFSMGMIQLILKTYDRLSAVYDSKLEKHIPSTRVNKQINAYESKLSIIKNSIYGLDIEPMAIEIARLRMWLSLIIDEVTDIEPLPNLDFNFVCTNSLIPLKSEFTTIFEAVDDNLEFEEKFERIRAKFFNAHSHEEKLKTKEEFDKLYEELIQGGETSKRVEQLKTWHPFEIKENAEFFDSKIMFNVEAFDIVIGNPPYIHFEKMEKNSRSFYASLRYDTYRARGDIYTLFYEAGVNILKENGILSYITSNKWMRTDYGVLLRNYFINNTSPELLIDLGSGVFENATVDTNILCLVKGPYLGKTKAVTLTKELKDENINNYVQEKANEIKFKKNKNWVILNAIEQKIKEKVENKGVILRLWENFKIGYGVKTGFNKAFIINEEAKKKILENCADKNELEKTKMMIRPILRGRDIEANKYNWAGLYVITAFFNSHKIIPKTYPALYNHLKQYEDKLKNRGQCRYVSSGKINDPHDINYPGYPGMHHWLELDNNPDKSYFVQFDEPKIIYSEIVQEPRFYLDKEKFVPEATAFYIQGDNLEYLTKVLNSSIVAWIFKKFYAGGGLGDRGFRYKKKYLEFLPIPLPETVKNSENIYDLSDEELEYIKMALKE